MMVDRGLYAVSSPTTDGKTVDTSIANRIWTWTFDGSSYISYNNQSYRIVPLSDYQNKSIENNGVMYIAQVYDPEYIAFDPGNANGVDGNSDTAGSMFDYGNEKRVEVDVGFYENNNQVTINLPSDSQLGTDYTVISQDTKTYKIPRETEYNYVLKGWYNIADGTYYDVSSGPTTATVNLRDGNGNKIRNVFMADWVAANYDLGETREGSQYNAVSTNDFITTKVFDYNELFNLSGLNLSQNNSVLSETWTDKTTDSTIGANSFIFNNTAHENGSIGNPNQLNTWNQKNANVNSADTWNITSPDNTLFQKLFSEDSETLGVNYLGKGDYLFHIVIDESGNKYYEYNSDYNASSYNQSDSRFYVWDDVQYVNSGSGVQPGFLPFNDEQTQSTTASTDGTYNYWFGLSSEIDFKLNSSVGTPSNKTNLVPNETETGEADLIFHYSGDDDTWIFIDDIPIVDLGGIHDKMTADINFSTGEITVTDSAGNDVTSSRANLTNLQSLKSGNHTLSMYYVERNGGSSDLDLRFNLNMLPEPEEEEIETVTASEIKVVKDWGETNSWNIPNSITARLYEDGEEYGAIELSNSNEWTGVWTDLDPDKEYYVKEDKLENFDDDYEYEEVTETNSTWNLATALSPGEFVIAHGSSVAMNNSLGMTNIRFNSGNLIVNDANLTLDNITWVAERSGNGFKLKNKASGQYLVCNNDGNLSTSNSANSGSVFYYEDIGGRRLYYINDWNGYLCICNENNSWKGVYSWGVGNSMNGINADIYTGVIDKNEYTKCTITNTYDPSSGTIEIVPANELSVEKKWAETSVTLPQSIEVKLYDDNSNLIDTQILNAQNDWKYTWENLDISKGYYVQETEVGSFKATYKYTPVASDENYAVKTTSLDYDEIVIAFDGTALNSSLGNTSVSVINGVIDKSSITDDIIWKVIPDGNGYKLQNKQTNQYLNITGNDDTLQTTTSSSSARRFFYSNQAGRRLCFNQTGNANGYISLTFENGNFATEYCWGEGMDNMCVSIFEIRAVEISTVNCTITNTFLPSITLKKIDRLTHKGISNTQFTLENAQGKYFSVSNGWVNDYTIIGTDNLGNITLSKIPDGYYILTEVTPAVGYSTPSEPITFTITNGAISEVNGTLAYLDENDPNNLTLIVENVKGYILPETGGIGTTIYSITGGLIIFISIFFMKKRKIFK